MTALLFVAFRNLRRARRRNALTGGTMALGTAALVLGGGLTDGIARQLTSTLVAVQTGHVQVVARPVDFVPQNSPFDAYGQTPLADAEEIARRIEAEGGRLGVRRASPLLHGRGTAIAGSRSSLASIDGIDPARERDLLAAHPTVRGTFLPAGDDTVTYVAEPVARKLRLQVGDAVTFVLQTPEGAVNSLDATVCGIFAKGAPWFDHTFYVSLDAAQRLFDREGAATNVRVLLRDPARGRLREAREAIAALAGAGRPAGEEDVVQVETLEQSGRFSFSIMQANRAALAVLSTFLFLAAAVGITNGMLMSVHERTREIGTIRAVGLRRGTVVRLFVVEGLVLGLLAAAAGVAVGGALVLHWGAQGIPMNTMTLAWMAGGDRLHPLLTARNVIVSSAAIVLLSTAASVYPAFVASRLEPREALHHV